MEQTAPSRQQDIARLTKHRSALTMPQDKMYFDLFTTQIEEIKSAILEERPLDERIKGLEASLARKSSKLSAIVQEIQAAQIAHSPLERDE